MCVYIDVYISGRPRPTAINTINPVYIITRNIFKKIYDEVTEDIFDMSNVRIFKVIEKKKNGGCLYFAMSSVS